MKFCPYCMHELGEVRICPACGHAAEQYRAASHHLAPGTVLADRYVLGQVYREDSSGITYLGRELPSGEKISVREYYPFGSAQRREGTEEVIPADDPSKTAYQKGKTAFLQKAVAGVQGSAAEAGAGVRDVFEANGTAYLITDYAAGRTSEAKAAGTSEAAGGSVPVQGSPAAAGEGGPAGDSAASRSRAAESGPGSADSRRSGRPGWLVPVLVIAAAVVLAIAVVLAVVVVPGMSGGDAKGPSASEESGTEEEPEAGNGEESGAESDVTEAVNDPEEEAESGIPEEMEEEGAGNPDSEEPEDEGALTVRDDAEIYTFRDGDGNVIEMMACDYFLGNDLIREDNGDTWSFSYDPEEGKGAVAVTQDGIEIGNYEIYYYITTESQEIVCELVNVQEPSETYVYYVEKVRVSAEGTGYLGGRFRNTVSDYSFMLYTPRAYEENVGSREAVVYGEAGEGQTWSYNTDTAVLTVYGTGEIEDYTQETFGERPWETFSGEARTIEIREGITRVGSYAFYGFEKLESLSVPGSVCQIGSFAFAYAGTEDGSAGGMYAELAEGVEQIGESAFLRSGLTDIALPESLAQIDDYAFCYCTELTALEIPAGTSSIGTAVLRGCVSLQTLTVIAGNESFCAEGNVLFNADQTLLIAYAAACEGESYTIPDSVTAIAESAFEGCVNLKEAVIPGSVAAMGDYIFRDSVSLESVVLQKGTTGIGSGMFQDCTGLTQVWMAITVTQIGNNAFDGCESLADVYYGGTGAVWEQVTIGIGNETLTGAQIHYSSLF